MNGLFLGLFLLSISVCSFSPGYGLSGERMRTALMAGGFGSSTNKNKSTKKLRKVGGYTGAGTKPLRVAANTFDKIYKQFGSDSINDVYVRSLKNDETQFWFVGKIAWQLELGKDTEGSSIPTPHEAVISQKRLILEYAKSLRPQNLGGPFSNSLEVWIAPGDSELEVAQNKVRFTYMYRTSFYRAIQTPNFRMSKLLTG